MVFTIRFCPYCGGTISSDEGGYFICSDCGKRTVRSRTNAKAFLLGKPYEEEYIQIIDLAGSNPKKALDTIDGIINATEEPNADMYFVRGAIHVALGEEGKAHNDWKKGLDLITDLRSIDSYVVAVCRNIVEIICMKEREYIAFNPIEYIDAISTEFGIKAQVPCKGIFYITVYRNFRMKRQSGELDDDPEIYPSVIPKLLTKILSYGRDFRTVNNIIDEVLEDFRYDPDTYEEDDNRALYIYSLLKSAYGTLSERFSEEHIVRIFRHWNDSNMYDLEYWIDVLMRSVKDRSILQKLSSFGFSNREDFDLNNAVEEYARKFLLLSEDGTDLSEVS